MLDDGVLSPHEQSILRDGFVMIPALSSGPLRPNPDPGPVDSAVPPEDTAQVESPAYTAGEQERLASISIDLAYQLRALPLPS